MVNNGDLKPGPPLEVKNLINLNTLSGKRIPIVHEGRVPPPGTPTPCQNTTCALYRAQIHCSQDGHVQ